MLADGDGVAHIHLAADGDDGVGVEAAVSPHRELPSGASVAYSPHRLTQKVGGAPNGVGAALAQPSHQHVAGSGGNGQQRVIASLAGVAVVACPLLGQTVGLADGGVQVDGQGRVAGSGPSRPGPCQQLPADPIQLADVAWPHRKLRRNVPRVDGALTTQPMRVASIKPLPNASGCLKYNVTGKSDLRNGYWANHCGYR